MYKMQNVESQPSRPPYLVTAYINVYNRQSQTALQDWSCAERRVFTLAPGIPVKRVTIKIREWNKEIVKTV